MRGDAIIFHACIRTARLKTQLRHVRTLQWAAVLTSERNRSPDPPRIVATHPEYGHKQLFETSRSSAAPMWRCRFYHLSMFCGSLRGNGRVKIPNRQCHRLANTDADICEETDEQRVCVRRVVRPCLCSLNHFGVFAVTSRLCGSCSTSGMVRTPYRLFDPLGRDYFVDNVSSKIVVFDYKVKTLHMTTLTMFLMLDGDRGFGLRITPCLSLSSVL